MVLCCKVMEHIIYHRNIIMEYLVQHQVIINTGFGNAILWNLSSQLVTVTKEILYSMDHKLQTADVILLDF